MSLVSEFKTFLQRGNAIDLAVGVIIGGAFGKIVSSVVGDLLMPPIGLALGGLNFTDLKLTLGGTAEAPVTLNYGNFLQASVDFVIIGFCVFLLVKAVNSMKRAEPAAAPAAPP
ncbi:MAG: large-conductance mechanosensitive channel protein MscL, partial [Thermoanaerobaculia bacterium]|nr:large-conductance mechanosensitive channel protein MscL [Thermoanaerobaculia bacterium]